MNSDDPWYIAIGRYVLKEWRILASAPGVFVAAIVVAVLVSGVAQHYFYAAQISGKNAQIEVLGQQVALFRDRLDAANAALAEAQREDPVSVPTGTDENGSLVQEDVVPPAQLDGLYALSVQAASPLDLALPQLRIQNRADVPIEFRVPEFYVIVNGRMMVRRSALEPVELAAGAMTSMGPEQALLLGAFASGRATVLLGITIEYGIPRLPNRFVLRAERRCDFAAGGRVTACHDTWNSDTPL